VLAKAARSRADEELVAAALALDLLTKAVGLPAECHSDLATLLRGGERRPTRHADAEERAAQLIAQREAINSFVVKMNAEAENIATREKKTVVVNTRT
jgi:hypothetical protein